MDAPRIPPGTRESIGVLNGESPASSVPSTGGGPPNVFTTLARHSASSARGCASPAG